MKSKQASKEGKEKERKEERGQLGCSFPFLQPFLLLPHASSYTPKEPNALKRSIVDGRRREGSGEKEEERGLEVVVEIQVPFSGWEKVSHPREYSFVALTSPRQPVEGEEDALEDTDKTSSSNIYSEHFQGWERLR